MKPAKRICHKFLKNECKQSKCEFDHISFKNALDKGYFKSYKTKPCRSHTAKYPQILDICPNLHYEGEKELAMDAFKRAQPQT